MKYLRIFLILLLIPFMVLAEECDVSNITITSMKPNKIEGNTEVISDPTFEDRTINLDLKMYEVGDSITYDMTIKNDSEEDYMIDENTFKTDSDYIEYILKTKDNSNVVKAKSSKELFLVVTYKNEIDDNLLTNNKFNASNSLKLSLNTDAKKEELSIITTDNVREIKNPITSVSSMLLVIVVLLIAIIGLLILIRYKNKYTKYILIMLSMLLIPTVYAICTCNIEVESTIEIEKKAKLFDTIDTLSKEENSCVTKYEGEVTDEVGKTVNASNVYFDKCMDKRNVIFGGFCWQVVRTTETGGTKLIYNGEPVDGKCESSRENHVGIVNNEGTYLTFRTNYLYSDSFDYDINSKKFTLINPKTAEELGIPVSKMEGKFTCYSEDSTCTTMYHINDFYNDEATATTTNKYIVDTIDYNSIGSNQYSVSSNSISMIGYMNNKKYDYKVDIVRNNTMFGSSFTYDERTNTYSLSGEIKVLDSWYSKYYSITSTHYTCLNTTGSCDKLAFIFLGNNNYAFYIELSGGKSIEDALNEMLYDENVNKNNSAIKTFIDTWYEHNMMDYTDKLENTVYCNNRSILSLGGWNPNGGSIGAFLIFKSNSNDINHNYDYNLICEKATDQFSVSNSKAKLTYPVALITREEYYHIGNYLQNVNDYIIASMSPGNFNSTTACISPASGGYTPTNNTFNTRPVISLKNNNIIKSGTGSEEDPWVIK